MVHFGSDVPRAVGPEPAPVAVLEEPMPEDPSGPSLLEPESQPALVNLPATVEPAGPGGESSTEPMALAGPMADFETAEALRWLQTVEGLTGAQRAAIRDLFVEDE